MKGVGSMSAKYRTEDGFEFTDKDLERWNESEERGEPIGTPGRFMVAPPSRPQLYGEELVNLGVKVPRSWRDHLDREASRHGKTRSEMVRDLISESF